MVACAAPFSVSHDAVAIGQMDDGCNSSEPMNYILEVHFGGVTS